MCVCVCASYNIHTYIQAATGIGLWLEPEFATHSHNHTIDTPESAPGRTRVREVPAAARRSVAGVAGGGASVVGVGFGSSRAIYRLESRHRLESPISGKLNLSMRYIEAEVN